MEIAHLQHVPLGREHGADVAATPHHALAPETLGENVKVQQPVEHRDDHALGSHGRRDGLERCIKVIGLARQ